MRVLLSTYGSRGDVQPLVALGLALQSKGVEALVSAPADAEFVELVEREAVPLAPAFMPVRQWIEQAKQSGLRLPQLAAKMVPAQYEAIATAAEGCDAIVATGWRLGCGGLLKGWRSLRVLQPTHRDSGVGAPRSRGRPRHDGPYQQVTFCASNRAA
jgi:UDP:flavonoid glycosyltransferase YjiC (YdhE family)